MTDDQFKALVKQLDTLLSPLKAIAIVQLARELYPLAERERLIAEYRALALADIEAHKALRQAYDKLTPPDMSYEERVKTCGEEEAKRQLSPVTVAMDNKRRTSVALDAFRNEHQLIARIFDSAE